MQSGAGTEKNGEIHFGLGRNSSLETADSTENGVARETLLLKRWKRAGKTLPCNVSEENIMFFVE